MGKGLIVVIFLVLIGIFGRKKPNKFYLHYFIFLGICVLPIQVLLARAIGVDPVDMLLLKSGWTYGDIMAFANYLVIVVGVFGILRNFLSGQTETNQPPTKE